MVNTIHSGSSLEISNLKKLNWLLSLRDHDNLPKRQHINIRAPRLNPCAHMFLTRWLLQLTRSKSILQHIQIIQCRLTRSLQQQVKLEHGWLLTIRRQPVITGAMVCRWVRSKSIRGVIHLLRIYCKLEQNYRELRRLLRKMNGPVAARGKNVAINRKKSNTSTHDADNWNT